MHTIRCRHLVSINCSCFLFVYLLAVAVFWVADNTIHPFAFTSIEFGPRIESR